MTLTDQRAVAEGAPTPTGRDRWVIRTAVAVAATVVVGSVAAVAWAWNYQPLLGGNITGVWGGNGAEVRTIDNYFGTEYRVVRAEQGSTVEVLMSLAVPLDAPAGVTVNSVGSPVPLTGGDMVGFADSAETSSRLERPVGAQRPAGNLANGPVALDPGDVLEVTITLTLPQCNGDETRDGWSSFGNEVPVDYSAFGISHTTNIPLGYALTFGDTPQCPARLG
jgi:hypothetical protein